MSTNESENPGPEDAPEGPLTPTPEGQPVPEEAERTQAEEKKKSGCISPLGCFALLGVVVVLGAFLAPNFIRARARGQLTACKSNLKNIGTAMEMYSTDNSGHYPDTIEALLPKYLKFIPECPAAGEPTYQLQTGIVAYNKDTKFPDYYFLYCEGDHHVNVSLPTNYPQYDGISGLLER